MFYGCVSLVAETFAHQTTNRMVYGAWYSSLVMGLPKYTLEGPRLDPTLDTLFSI